MPTESLPGSRYYCQWGPYQKATLHMLAPSY